MVFLGLFDETIQALLNNLPEAIGVMVATLILAGGAALVAKVKQKSARLSDKAALQSTVPNSVIANQYISDLTRRGSSLSFGDPASWTVGNTEGEGLVTLDQIWTPLRVADSQMRLGKAGTHENMADEGEGTDLRTLFDSTNQGLVILGGPGSGKSTSLAMFAVDAARTWLKDPSNLLPIWVNLATVGGEDKLSSERLLLTGVPELERAKSRSGAEGESELRRLLSDAILQSRALLLLDGLDEVNEYVLPRVRGAVASVLAISRGTRL